MIGIVIVSHSKKLAEGVCELAQQMVQDRVPIAIAGGTDNPDEPIGTDPIFVLEAIESVYSDDGVLVLMDLGSALMSAEAAIEFLPEEQQPHIYLCEAPIVEGVMAAAVQAMIGGSIKEVYKEACDALMAKRAQLAPILCFKQTESSIADAIMPLEPLPTDNNAVETLTVIVPNTLGLHARPAAKLVAQLSEFDANVQVTLGDRTANGKSINQVAILGARQGDRLDISASGRDAEMVLQAIQALADANFGDPREESVPDMQAPLAPSAKEQSAVAVEGQFSGIPVCDGIGIGPVIQYRPKRPIVESYRVDDSSSEWQRLQRAIEAASTALAEIRDETARYTNAEDAAIFDAHRLMLHDVALLEAVEAHLYTNSTNAEAAWQSSYEAMAQQYRALGDEYLRARGDDLVDVGWRVLGHLMQIEEAEIEIDEPGVLVVDELTPSLAAQLKPEDVRAIVTVQGGSTGHGAVLARALGIPTIAGVDNALGHLRPGQQVIVDGFQGTVWYEPTAEMFGRYQTRQDEWLTERETLRTASLALAYTQDGRRVEVGANIGRVEEIDGAIATGAEGVGLFRTEFLFMGRGEPPSEEEQFDAYAIVAKRLDGRPLIIRTLDVGGDKPISYLPQGKEENPFLGWRGIRFCLEMPDIFKPQLRAILRASTYGNVKIMFPMISTVDELRRARSILADVQTELQQEGIPFDEALDIGVMIEVPAAVWQAEALAKEVDFFSIGTNDLTQYIMAADRGNARVAGLVDSLQPAVLAAIQHVVTAAHEADIWVGMCGEFAGDPNATALLVGLGLDELSMSASRIPAVKEAIRQI